MDRLLTARVIRLEAIVEVRTVLRVPSDWGRRDWQYKQNQYRSAYESGYEVGWRGQPPGEPYPSQDWMQKAYLAGCEAGRKDSDTEIIRVIERPLKQKDKTA